MAVTVTCFGRMVATRNFGWSLVRRETPETGPTDRTRLRRSEREVHESTSILIHHTKRRALIGPGRDFCLGTLQQSASGMNAAFRYSQNSPCMTVLKG